MLSDTSMIYVLLCCFKIKIFYMNKSKAVHFLVILPVKKIHYFIKYQNWNLYFLVSDYMLMTT